jgi:hypothetical protein
MSSSFTFIEIILANPWLGLPTACGKGNFYGVKLLIQRCSNLLRRFNIITKHKVLIPQVEPPIRDDRV